MLWCDELAAKVNGPQLINDSKTPSGRVHVGALRGVLIHHAVFRALRDRGVPVRFIFGVDDYDPLDELPAGESEHFEKYLGAPLCNVPPPPGSSAASMSEHYIKEFFDVFAELGVAAEPYRMNEIYRSGKFNEAIDLILRAAPAVRTVYKDVSHSERSEAWYPFQVVCEKCGRIGTTEVTGYDGKEATYSCRPDLVRWARGCGHQGKVSPFDGRGKLPWKLEWVAKWQVLGVTIEGAGKDHNTKGGSRDVAATCLREIFRRDPPMNIPYEFFLVGGAKMSSSKGVGAAVRDMADFLPPEVLRFLMIRTPPNRPVNFSPDEKNIIKVFNEFDRCHQRSFHDPKVSEEDKRIYALSEIAPEGDFHETEFQIVATLIQLPHLDAYKEIEKRKGASLTEAELKHLNRRVQAARYWLEHYASEEEKTRLQPSLPARAGELGPTQRAFLQFLAEALPKTPWKEDALQSKIFEVARLTPIEQPAAFKAMYRVLLDRESGPKAGNLLAFLDSEFVIRRFKELAYSKTDFWNETAVSPEVFRESLVQEKSHISSVSAAFEFQAAMGFVEFLVKKDDAKTYMNRVRVEGESHSCAVDLVRRLAKETGIEILEAISKMSKT